MTDHSRTRKIALAYPVAEAHFQAITRGITDYARQHGCWHIVAPFEESTLGIDSLGGWKGDGIVASVTTGREAEAAARFKAAGVPVVSFSGSLEDVDVHRVRLDNAAVGIMAADHLIACGYRHFACYGIRDVAYSDARLASFQARVREMAGASCQVHLAAAAGGEGAAWTGDASALELWLGGLSRATAVFAVNDMRARMVADACSFAGLEVPGDISIIGVDNNLVLCEIGEPSLTSVSCDWRLLGYELARQLDGLMERRPGVARDRFVPPKAVVQRESTISQPCHDATVACAIDFMRKHLQEDLGVEDIVEACRVSRRMLEKAFTRAVKCSPYQYLCRMRVELAKEFLLDGTRLKISDISWRCGFSDVRRFHMVFRRIEGLSPCAYRDAQRVRPSRGIVAIGAIERASPAFAATPFAVGGAGGGRAR